LVQLKLPKELCRFPLKNISVEFYIQKRIVYTRFLPQLSDLYRSGCSAPSFQIAGYTRNTESVKVLLSGAEVGNGAPEPSCGVFVRTGKPATPREQLVG